jgi:coenzyme F420-reducing hydrogenase alpha subunit
MTVPAGADIDIALELAEDRVVGVRIVPRRLPPIGALVAGWPAADMLRIVPRLFTLCAAAHGAAAQTAVDAANGIRVAPAVRRQRAAAVLSERLVEQLRSAVTGLRLLEQGAIATAMRELISASATFASAADSGIPERLRAIARIELALDQIGIAGLNPTDDSLAARFSPSGIVYLSSGDDLEVIARLVRDGARYASAPDIDGAVPETGPWARLGADTAIDGQPGDRAETAAARLQARLDEIVRMPRMLRGLATGEDDSPLADLTGYCLGDGGGAAAVETARGRLYHHVELDAGGRVNRFQCLAPTEWNFHPRGPLARMLRGSTLAGNSGGRSAVEQLVAAFDPCVGYTVTVREVADA